MLAKTITGAAVTAALVCTSLITGNAANATENNLQVTASAYHSLSLQTSHYGYSAPYTPALQESDSTSSLSCPFSDGTAPKLTPVSNEVADNLLKQTRDLQSSSQIEVSSSISSLDFDQVKVYAVPTSAGVHHSVTIPIKGALPISNYTVVYDPNGEVSNYAETVVEKTESGLVHIKQWINGELSRDEAVYVGESAFDSPNIGAPSSFAGERSWGKAVACVATVLGVSGGTAALVLSLCGGSCAAPEPTFSKAVCAACIGGIVTLGGGTITGVVTCFGYW